MTAAPGTNLQLRGLEFGLGVYNLLGGLFLLVVAVILLLWSLSRLRWLAAAGALVAAVAAVLLRVQIGFDPPLLGGDGSSAAYYFTLTVVALALTRRQVADADQAPPGSPQARATVGPDTPRRPTAADPTAADPTAADRR